MCCSLLKLLKSLVTMHTVLSFVRIYNTVNVYICVFVKPVISFANYKQKGWNILCRVVAISVFCNNRCLRFCMDIEWCHSHSAIAACRCHRHGHSLDVAVLCSTIHHVSQCLSILHLVLNLTVRFLCIWVLDSFKLKLYGVDSLLRLTKRKMLMLNVSTLMMTVCWTFLMKSLLSY